MEKVTCHVNQCLHKDGHIIVLAARGVLLIPAWSGWDSFFLLFVFPSINSYCFRMTADQDFDSVVKPKK